MKLISHNPYRIAGILSNSSEKDLLKQKSKIKRFSEIGKEVISDYDFPFLETVQREDSKVNKAFSEIEQNQNKVTHSLYWFLNMNSVDNTAIQHLINGDKNKALEIWEKLTSGKNINAKNFSAFNNIGTLYLLGPSEEEIKKGIETKIRLIESDSFKDFVHTVADQTATVIPEKQIEIFINELLRTFKGKYSESQTMALFSNCNGTTEKYLLKQFSEEPIHRIEAQIEKCKANRSKNKAAAYNDGLELYKNTKNDLALIKSVLGLENLQYKTLVDNVAKEILQCSIDYFNVNVEDDNEGDYLEQALKLAKIAQGIAVNKLTKERIKDNIGTLAGMKDREIIQAIEVLRSVKKAYETNEAQIMKQVSEMRLGYNQSINWTKVNEMIANSLDWKKVIDLIKEVIPPNNVEKIKNAQNQPQLEEYKALVNFLFGKLNIFQKNQIKYLNYWQTFGLPPKPRPGGSTPIGPDKPSWSEENPGCFILLIIAGLILLVFMFSFAPISNKDGDEKSAVEQDHYQPNNSTNAEIFGNEQDEEETEESIDFSNDKEDNYLDEPFYNGDELSEEIEEEEEDAEEEEYADDNTEE